MCIRFFFAEGSLKLKETKNWFQLFLSPSVFISADGTVGVYLKRTRRAERKILTTWKVLQQLNNTHTFTHTVFIESNTVWIATLVRNWISACSSCKSESKIGGKSRSDTLYTVRRVYKMKFSAFWPQFSGIVVFKQLRKCMPITFFMCCFVRSICNQNNGDKIHLIWLVFMVSIWKH